MPRYVLIMKQRGQGCDYTIGCAQRISILEATTLETARQEAEQEVRENLVGELKGPNLVYAMVARVEEEFPVVDWYDQDMMAEDKKKQQQVTEQERREFERLKKKFGSP